MSVSFSPTVMHSTSLDSSNRWLEFAFLPGRSFFFEIVTKSSAGFFIVKTPVTLTASGTSVIFYIYPIFFMYRIHILSWFVDSSFYCATWLFLAVESIAIVWNDRLDTGSRWLGVYCVGIIPRCESIWGSEQCIFPLLFGKRFSLKNCVS